MNTTEFIAGFNEPRHHHNYTLLSHIETGGQADVYRGTERSTSDDVAVKVFHLSPLQRDSLQADVYVKEGRRLKSLNGSPHLVNVHWQDVHVGTYPFLAMEYVAGGTVAGRMEPGKPMPTEQAISYIGQTMVGMMHAHGDSRPSTNNAPKLVHRDLKPANLLVSHAEAAPQIPGFPDMSPYGCLKITDFGISAPGHLNEHTLTGTQVAAGTLPYMPREQFEAKAVFASDVYSLGALAYELLAGYRPISIGEQDDNIINWYNAHAQQPVLPIGHRRYGGSDPIIDLVQAPILKALEKSTQHRFSTMGDFYESFAEAVGKGTALARKDRTTISLAAARPGQAEPVSQTMYLGRRQVTHRQTEQPSETATKAPTRRRALQALGVGSLVLLGGDSMRRVIPGSAEIDNRSEKQIVVDIAHDVLADLMQRKYIDQAAFLIRHLVPLQPRTMLKQVQAIRTTIDPTGNTGAWLAAELAEHLPDEAITIMEQYENDGRLEKATIVATAVASYSNISGDGTDPASRAVSDIVATCVNQDYPIPLKTISAAQSPKFPFRLVAFGEHTTSSEIMDELQVRRELASAQALGMANARHTPAFTGSAIAFYDKLLATPSGQTTAVSTVLKGLCVALAPYEPLTVVKELQRLGTDNVGIRDETAQELALELCPFAPDDVAAYIDKKKSEPFSMGIASMGLAKSHPAVLQKMTPLVPPSLEPWMRVAKNPRDAKSLEAGMRVIRDKSLASGYGGMIAAALLMSYAPTD